MRKRLLIKMKGEVVKLRGSLIEEEANASLSEHWTPKAKEFSKMERTSTKSC